MLYVTLLLNYQWLRYQDQMTVPVCSYESGRNDWDLLQLQTAVHCRQHIGQRMHSAAVLLMQSNSVPDEKTN